MDIYFIRHGQSLADIENKCEGAYDSPLTDLGRDQVKETSHYFKAKNIIFDIIYASTLCRTHETAQIISKNQTCDIIASDQIREMNNGLWAGMPKEQRDREYPNKGKPPYFRDFNEPIPGGESYKDLATRAFDFYTGTIKKEERKTIAIVSHGGFINALLGTILNNKMLENYFHTIFPTGDAGWHCLRRKNGHYYLLSQNSTPNQFL